MNRFIDPLTDLGRLLLTVEKPARYTGGEYGRLCNPDTVNLARNGQPDKEKAVLKTLIAFPDLYEIGMSNQAFRIVYKRLNSMEGIFCDRAFAPAPDFEELLRKNGLPLYGLDTGISLKNPDLLMFTLGYELGLTNIFLMMDISGIPLRCAERTENDPLVIMGGPCVSNPLPYSAFIDAFWIGEAEGGFFELVQEIAEMKRAGGKRNDFLIKLAEHPSVWTKGKGKAVRAIDSGFADGKNGPAVFPVPSMKVIHHHGSVEIMRGCPNGCRFCHAGYWYRPMRQKNAGLVEAETEAFIRSGGYREISLSSLSSGDYLHLDILIDSLNARFGKEQISFQLPSLKVSGFSLNLLEKISEVRKSGLTFAVETPVDFWQMAINKKVSGADIVAILREAKRRGWKSAKFYFMIGLPLQGKHNPENQIELKSEEEEIISFIEKIARLTGMRFNINIGTFVPKPHTPFQRAAQLDFESSEKKLTYLQTVLKSQGHKVGVQDPLISIIEGAASRGDERAGELFLSAFNQGCRLDSWNEYLKREIWESLVKSSRDIINNFLEQKNDKLPWDFIDSGIEKSYFLEEEKNSLIPKMTQTCINNCNSQCGICDVINNIQLNNKSAPVLFFNNNTEKNPILVKKQDPETYRIIFSFSKTGSAVFHSHLSLLEIFSMSFKRANLPVLYSQGFNPLPRLDIASPLSLGIKADCEIASVDMNFNFEADNYKNLLNKVLPEGFKITEAINIVIPSGTKKHSVSALLWGFEYLSFEYLSNDGKTDLVPKNEEKNYRLIRTGQNESLYGIERLSVLAKDIKNPGNAAGRSYFDVFKELYV